MLLSDNEENGLLSMKKNVLHSNHLAEIEITRIKIFLKAKSVGCEELSRAWQHRDKAVMLWKLIDNAQ